MNENQFYNDIFNGEWFILVQNSFKKFAKRCGEDKKVVTLSANKTQCPNGVIVYSAAPVVMAQNG